MPSLLSCSSTSSCTETTLELVFSLASFVAMAHGLRVITQDLNKTLVKIDREIYCASTFSLMLLSFYFALFCSIPYTTPFKPTISCSLR
jgi:hypothetical protein